MNKSKKGESKGISIRTVLTLFSVLSVTIFFVIGLVTFILPVYNNKTTNLGMEILDCQLQVSTFKDGCEYLTRQARLYVENGDIVYLKNYCKEASETKRTDSAVNSLKNKNLGAEADRQLQNMVDSANNLRQKETYAIKLAALTLGETDLPESLKNIEITEEDLALTDEKKAKKIRALVFGNDYVKQEEDLRTNAGVYLKRITEAFNEDLTVNDRSIYALMVTQRVLIGLMVIVVVTMFAFWIAFFMWPIKDYIKSIEANKPFSSGGLKELRLLSKSYNKLYKKSALEKEELVIRAERDGLTGLMNQRAFVQLNDVLKDYKGDLALLVIDIDHFKQINDVHGHEVGDTMLKLVATELLNVADVDSRVIRLGGDEFVVLEKSKPVNAENIKRKIDGINEYFMKPSKDRPSLSISVGVAFSDKGYTDELFRQADQAMYFVKRNGGKGIHIYENNNSSDGNPSN